MKKIIWMALGALVPLFAACAVEAAGLKMAQGKVAPDTTWDPSHDSFFVLGDTIVECDIDEVETGLEEDVYSRSFMKENFETVHQAPNTILSGLKEYKVLAKPLLSLLSFAGPSRTRNFSFSLDCPI